MQKRTVALLVFLFGTELPVFSADTAPPPDSPDFIAREEAVRQEFLARHPMPAGAFSGKFVIAFAEAVRGEVEPPLTPSSSSISKPSYWSKQGTAWLEGIPFGAAIAKAFSAGRQAQAGDGVDRHAAEAHADDRVDRIAMQNQQNFKLLVARLGIASEVEFESAEPLMRVRYLTKALRLLYDQVTFPCPLTVFLLDASPSHMPEQPTPNVDSETPPAGITEKQWKKIRSAMKRAPKYAHSDGAAPSQPSTLPDSARIYVSRLLGAQSTEYSDFPTYSREQKTNALSKAFKTFADAGIAVADDGRKERLVEYFKQLSANVRESPSGWALVDEFGRETQDTELIEKEFGALALKKFLAKPESPDKDSVRIAAFILFTQFQAVASGILAG